jgi:hypothetical protein
MKGQLANSPQGKDEGRCLPPLLPLLLLLLLLLGSSDRQCLLHLLPLCIVTLWLDCIHPSLTPLSPAGGASMVRTQPCLHALQCGLVWEPLLLLVLQLFAQLVAGDRLQEGPVNLAGVVGQTANRTQERGKSDRTRLSATG